MYYFKFFTITKILERFLKTVEVH